MFSPCHCSCATASAASSATVSITVAESDCITVPCSRKVPVERSKCLTKKGIESSVTSLTSSSPSSSTRTAYLTRVERNTGVGASSPLSSSLLLSWASFSAVSVGMSVSSVYNNTSAWTFPSSLRGSPEWLPVLETFSCGPTSP